MTGTLIATLDGRLHDADEPLISADDFGLLRGDGIFDATLVVGGVPRDLDEHLARLGVSARKAELDLPPEDSWRRGVDAVIGGWRGGAEMVLRLVCTRGRESGGPVTAFVLGSALSPHAVAQRTDGVRVLLLNIGHVAAAAAQSPWLLAGTKTLSYAVNMAAKRYAEANDADDAIYLGSDGAVLEGSTSSVVVARGRTLLTPPADGILAGVTVRRLFRDAAQAGWTTRTQALRPEDLRAADGVWLTSGARLLAPVVAIDGTPQAIGTAHQELAEILQVP